MPVVVVFMFVISTIFYTQFGSLNGFSNHKKNIKYGGGIAPSSHSFGGSFTKYKNPYTGGLSEDFNAQEQKDLIETTLVRTCEVVNIKMHENGCAGMDDPAVVWKFAGGTAAASKTLSSVWGGTQSSVFTCAGADRYGRYLLKRTIPSSYISAGGFSIALSGMTTNGGKFTDPCGYKEFIIQ